MRKILRRARRGTTAVCAPDEDENAIFHAYLLTPASAVPGPAALPLFATGLGVLALLARRRKKHVA